MATYYWVGGAGTWNTSTTTNWASSSNGSGGAGVPTSADDVIIDTSSGTGTITCTGAVCNDITVTASQAIILGAASSTLSVFGNLTFPSGGSFSANTNSNTITFAGTTTGKIITTNGKILSIVVFNGVGGGWTLGSALSCNGSTFTLTNGTFDTSSTNNYSLSIGGSFNLGAGTKTLNLNASTFTLSGSGTPLNFATNATGFTLNAGTSTINCSAASPTFAGGGLTYYNVGFTSTALNVPVITGANTFNNLTFTSLAADGIVRINIDSNQTVNGTLTLGAGNTAVRRMMLFSSSVGTQRTITVTTVATLSDVDFRDISFSASQSGTRLGDCGGNNNITFPAAKTVYWNLAGSQGWNAIGWAPGSGGTPAVNNFPLAQDTAVIDNSSAGTNINLFVYNVGTVDMSNRTTAFTLTFFASPNLNVYGDWKTGTGITYANSGVLQFTGRTIQKLTSVGVSFTNGITINTAPSGSVQLQDAFTTASTATVTLTQGTLDLANQTLSTGAFSSSNSNTRVIAFGTGNITTTGSGTAFTTATATNLTYTGTPTVNISNNSATATSVLSGTASGGAETNAFDFNFTTGTYALTLSGGSNVRNLNFTGFTGTWSPGSSGSYAFYGSLTLVSGMTFTTGSAIWNFTATSGIQVITSAGKTLFSITQSAAGGTVRLADNMSLSSTYTQLRGTFDLNDFTLTTSIYNGSNANTRVVAFGTTGSIVVTGSGTTIFAIAGSNTSYTGTCNVNIANNSGTAATVSISTGSTEATAFSLKFTTGTYALTLTTPTGASVNDLDFTGFSGSWAHGVQNTTFYGNLILSPTMTFTTPTGGLWTWSHTSGSKVITSAGKTLYSITQNTTGGTVTLGDDITLSNTYTLTNGTFNLSNQNFTALTFSSSNSNTRTITMGSGTWTLSGTGTVWNLATITNLTFNANTSTIVLSDTSATARTFAGGSLTYNNLTIGGATGTSTLTITGTNTFATLASTKTVAHTITFPNVTTTVSDWTITGTAGNVVTLTRTGASGTFTLAKSGGGVISGVDYLNISNSTASPTNTWYAGANSTNGGGNTGWSFTTFVPVLPIPDVRLYISGNLLIANTSIFDEMVQSNVRLTKTSMFAGEFDEVTGTGSTANMRFTRQGNVLISGQFDEVTGLS